MSEQDLSQVSIQEQEAMEAKVRELLDVLKMDLKLEKTLGPNSIYFNVTGPDTQFFQTHHGETLRNVTYLLHTLHESMFPNSTTEVKFDAGRMLADNETEIQEMVLAAAARVRESHQEVVLGPFNPYERRLIHLALQDEKGVTTESIGNGHLKKVAVRLTDQT